MYQYFKLDELKCKCGQCKSDGSEMDSAFMFKLEKVRHELKFPFIVTSAYRCPAHNEKVSHTGKEGPHTTGKAIDISVSHYNAYALIRSAIENHFTGIGIHQKGNNRFIHLDTLTGNSRGVRPTVWSY